MVRVIEYTTEAFDRGDKFADYQTSLFLREYVLVNQSRMSIECFRFSESGSWVSQTYEQDSEVYFASIGVRS